MLYAHVPAKLPTSDTGCPNTRLLIWLDHMPHKKAAQYTRRELCTVPAHLPAHLLLLSMSRTGSAATMHPHVEVTALAHMHLPYEHDRGPNWPAGLSL